MLQAGGACYSWRLPPPRRLGGKRLREARQGDCAVLWKSIVRGLCSPLGRSRRATLVECGLWIPILLVFLASSHRGIGTDHLLAKHKVGESPQRGLGGSWQASRDLGKNHRVNIVSTLLGGLHSPYHKTHIYIHISFACVVALVIS